MSASVRRLGKQAARWSSCRATPCLTPLRLGKVLVVTKTSRLDVERVAVAAAAGAVEVSDDEVVETLRRRGSRVAEMIARHDTHTHNVAVLLDALSRMGTRHDVVSSAEYCDGGGPDPHRYDAVLSAGGDGTFIVAAGRVEGDTPVIGINTDPERSAGRLLLTPATELDPAQCLAEIEAGRFRRIARRRIRVELSDGVDGARELVAHRAMNEVFVSESEAYKTLNYTAAIDDGPWAEHRNSGLLVCTGSGSTAWSYNEAKIDTNVAATILELGTGAPCSPLEAQNVASRYNAQLVFDPTESRMKYTQLAPIVETGGLESVTGRSWRGHIPAGGFARTMQIRSSGWNGFLAVDSAETHPFGDGRIATLSLPNADLLQTVALSGGGVGPLGTR